MQTPTSAPTIDVAKLSIILNEKYANAMSGFVFRRVKSVDAKPEDLDEVRYYVYDDGVTSEYEPLKVEEIAKLTPQEIEQYVQYRYRKFTAYTGGAAVREDMHDGCSFTCSSNNLGVFNPITLEWSRARANIRSASIVPPRVGDLVCGVVDSDKPNVLKHWFVCSEQFLRFWTAVMFEDHETFDVKCRSRVVLTEEERFAKIKRWLMSGNRLCTNSFRKWVLSEGADPTNGPEIAKRLFVLRTEDWSHMSVHIYAALVLIIRYAELPTDANVPQNLDGPNGKVELKMKHWDLPVNFINQLISHAGM